MSLDVWISKNHHPVLGIIGHWITEGFLYQERVLEFAEFKRAHSGENLAATIQLTLSELDLEEKLISITGDNSSNNEAMASELYYNLKEKIDDNNVLLFQGLMLQSTLKRK